MSELEHGPLPPDVQFQRAEPVAPSLADLNGKQCVVCKSPTGPTYFHAQGQVVCPVCAQRIQTGQEKPPALSLGRGFLYGLGAAIAGCILYAAVAIILDLTIGIVAIVVGL